LDAAKRKDIKGMSGLETEAWALGLGLKAYRGNQIRQWLFQKLAESFEEMTPLSKKLRSQLSAMVRINSLKEVGLQVSRDGTRKYLFQLEDGHTIESVLIPEKDHFTLCISSQAGCGMGCRFCLTAIQGLKRSLTAAEIVEQVIQVKRSMTDPEELRNVVFMGMGEPLANYAQVIRAIHNLISEDGMNFSHRKVTLSTCGLVPNLVRFGADVSVNLAVSLNAGDNETRSKLMPVNQAYPLESLMAACRKFPLPNRRMITFEYILIEGVNDHEKDARKVARLLSGTRAKINLIPFNPHAGSDFSPTSPEKLRRFQEILLSKNYTAIIRKSKGQDISAACGQLSGTALSHPLVSRQVPIQSSQS
jgi:23S rRNA (adenine2503-C2)-methyltransferase